MATIDLSQLHAPDVVEVLADDLDQLGTNNGVTRLMPTAAWPMRQRSARVDEVRADCADGLYGLTPKNSMAPEAWTVVLISLALLLYRPGKSLNLMV